jgi:hypothetical protein
MPGEIRIEESVRSRMARREGEYMQSLFDPEHDFFLHLMALGSGSMQGRTHPVAPLPLVFFRTYFIDSETAECSIF